MKSDQKKILTLCIIHQHPKVLLGMKRRGFGQGRWNGFGGKVQAGESIEAAGKRELQEEAGIIAGTLEAVGIIDFEFKGNPELLEAHIFKGTDFTGTVTETEEMRPQWFPVDEIPFEEMWPVDAHWFPLFLSGKKFKGKVLYGEGDKILEMKFSEVEKVS